MVDIRELVIEMKQMERRMTLYEEKYGVLSEDFYAALMAGKLARYDEYDESRADFSRWKGIYETWRRRKQSYAAQIQQGELADALRIQPAYYGGDECSRGKEGEPGCRHMWTSIKGTRSLSISTTRSGLSEYTVT